jgi:hypothetical protein
VNSAGLCIGSPTPIQTGAEGWVAGFYAQFAQYGSDTVLIMFLHVGARSGGFFKSLFHKTRWDGR